MQKVLGLLVVIFILIGGGLSSGVFAQEAEVHWSEEKEAIYRPLLGSTLPWYDEVMKLGGFDFDTETVITDRTKADIVMNMYSDIGARKIARIDSFGKPLDKNSIVFPTDGLGYPLTSMDMAEGDLFLIEASDGKFIQIRIDRIVLPTEVYFTYAVEQDVPVKEDLTQYTSIDRKYTRDHMKVWTVRFNQMADPQTINSSTVYVKDSKGYLFATNLTMAHDNQQVYVSPLNPYESDETYTIYVSKEIKNTSGKAMKKGSLMPFVLDLNSSYPDQTEPQQLSGLHAFNQGDTVRLTWFSSSANDLAGYLVYYRLEGKEGFKKLLKSNGDDLYYSAEVDLTGIQHIQGQRVEFYVTAVDRSGNESIPSNLIPFTFEDDENNPNPEYSRYFGQWDLELAYVNFGSLQVFEDGSYTWNGGPNGSSSGEWKVLEYGFVLINADGGDDYVIEPSSKNPSGIKLLTVTDGTYNDGSPILLYFCDGE